MMLDTSEPQRRAASMDEDADTDKVWGGLADRSILKRALLRELAEAQTLLQAGSPTMARAIHLARRSLKRIRTLLLVVADVRGTGDAGRAEPVKQAFQLLAGQRDADAMLAAARWLLERAGARSADAIAIMVARLATEAEDLRAKPVAVAEILHLLRVAEVEVAALAESDDPSALLQAGLIAVYRKGRKLYRAAAEAQDTDDSVLHGWRKQVKHRMHICQVIVDHWPQRAEFPIRALDHLADLLGQEHDFDNLGRWIRAEAAVAGTPVDVKQLGEAIKRRRAKLAARAIEFGAELYEQRTRLFERELQTSNA